MTRNTEQATLLFAHGASFCKEVWDPIIRRLKSSPLLQRLSINYVSFDFPYHGSKRDNYSVPVHWDRSNPHSLRAIHPATEMVTDSAYEVMNQVQHLQHNYYRKQSPLIGIGHSMGAGALWRAEVLHPGTFDSLILFEPGYGMLRPERPENAYVTDFLVALALERESSWPSMTAARDHFHQLKNFSRWDRETLEGYMKGALVEDKNDGSMVLACHPHIEAALYCHKSLLFTDQELARPQCQQITFHYGDRTKMFLRELFDPMTEKWPHLYRIGEPMSGLSHLMVLEDPEAATAKILEDLDQLEPFQEAFAEQL